MIKTGYNDYLPFIIPPGPEWDYTHAFPRPYAMQTVHHPVWTAARYSYALKFFARTIRPGDLTNPYRDFSGTANREQLEEFDFSSNSNRFGIYAENIRSMIALCRVRGITPYVLDLPVSQKPEHYRSTEGFRNNYGRLMAEFEEECRRICREEGIEFIETKPLPGDVFADHCHLLPKGNDHVARIVAKALRQVCHPGE